METFEELITSTAWTELLNGKTYLAFDVIKAGSVEVYLNESAEAPALDAEGHKVKSWPDSFDFELSGALAPTQRVWVKTSGVDTFIRGVRD